MEKAAYDIVHRLNNSIINFIFFLTFSFCVFLSVYTFREICDCMVHRLVGSNEKMMSDQCVVNGQNAFSNMDQLHIHYTYMVHAGKKH